MQVVKLGDGGVTGRNHFRIDLTRNGEQCSGVDNTGQRVHACTPGPESILAGRAALLGVTRQQALKSMTVRVHQPRDDDANFEIAVFDSAVSHNRRDLAGGDLEPYILGPASCKQRFPGK